MRTRFSLLLLVLGACSDSNGQDPAEAGVDATSKLDTRPPTLFGGARPVSLRVPPGHDPAKPTPLVLVLHGYGASGYLQATLLGYVKQFEESNFLLAYPNGTANPTGNLFWNATDACCDFNQTGIDDSTYLIKLIEEIQAVYNVDPRRIYLIGHSNGGFMAYRMACDHADRIAAIISLAGATFIDPGACKPSSTVSVLQIHGELDDAVEYAGGSTDAGPFPGAVTTVATWAGYDKCGATRSVVPGQLDLDSLVQGAETVVERFDGCPAGIDVELWTMKGSGHLPIPTDDFRRKTWEFLERHAKPGK